MKYQSRIFRSDNFITLKLKHNFGHMETACLLTHRDVCDGETGKQYTAGLYST